MKRCISSCLLRIFFPLLVIIICPKIVRSQINDSCVNAIDFGVSNNGYGTGVYAQNGIEISNATVEVGESFASAIFIAGQDRKSLWFKFTIAAKRSVYLDLRPVGSSFTTGDVGFTVYRTSNCLPGVTDISTKITPFEIFGTSGNPCVDPGTYLVQLTAKQSAVGFVNLVLTINTPITPYDAPSQAHDFGTLPLGISTVAYDVSCLSLQNPNELCNNLSGTYKTSWHVFNTPAYFDYITFMIASKLPGGNRSFGYRLYRGDVRSNSYTTLPVVEGCDSLYMNLDRVYFRQYTCDALETNTLYSIQLFFEDGSEDSVRVGMMVSGLAPTQAPEPIAGLIPASNQFGSVSGSIVGNLFTRSDRWSCNSRHSIHPCNPALPATGINGFSLSSFFTLNLTSYSNLYLEGLSTECQGSPPQCPLIRIFKTAPATNCSNLTDSVKKGEFVNNGFVSCLDPGDYIIQVLGREISSSIPNFYYDQLVNSPNPLSLFSNLGSSFNLNVTAFSAIGINNFSLNTAGAFDTINGFQPLASFVSYDTQIDTFGCSRTVIPYDNICPASPQYDRAIYREFRVVDSGVAGIYYTGIPLPNKIYKGDANALASAQNVFSFPDSIHNLRPVTGCMTGNENFGNRACVVPGTYTTVEWGDSNTVGPVWNYQNPVRPYKSTIVFTKDTAVHNTPSDPENMGDVLTRIPPTGGTIRSSIIYISCKGSADTIRCNGGSGGGVIKVPPCLINGVPANKAIYREFYLSREATITIYSTLTTVLGYSIPGYMTMFYGRISVPSSLRTIVPGFECSGGSCKRLPAGWYTTVSYATGPSYQVPTGSYDSNFNFAGMGESITIDICPGAKFNRPYKAAYDTTTRQPFLIEWNNQGTVNGTTGRYYVLPDENFGCSNDTPFSSHPIIACGRNSTKVTYYVFRLTQESYLKIYTYMPVPGGNIPMWTSLYNRNIRTDSMMFPSLQPIQPCIESDSIMIICRAQPGVYTLAVFYQEDSRCLLFTPKIWIDQTGLSRFDFAAKTYDFGSIPPDSTFHNGKVGDVNPINPSLAPSQDAFYCTTSASGSDPLEDTCKTFRSSRINDKINNYLFPDSTFIWQPYWIPRRNLWYSFVIKGGGNIRVRVNELSPSSQPSRFSIYKSDMNPNMPLFAALNAGFLDSTYAQGLSYITSNKLDTFSCITTANEATFTKQPCFDTRYFILVTNQNEINHKITVEILYDSIAALPAGDRCSNAVPLLLPGPGTNSSSANVTCHEIGTDYGEFYSTLSCPPAGVTANFKSTWFKIVITGVDTMDLRTSINNHSTAGGSTIKYRLMSGNCGAMQERSCVQDGQTVNTYKCLPPGEYYVQVFTPVAVNGYVVEGTIDLVATVQQHQDSCSPINPCLATSRFVPQFDCNTDDSVKCFNFSTYGNDIVYNWNGGYNNQVSSALAPSFSYPRLSQDRSYVIRLITTNRVCGGRDTFRVAVNIPARPSLHLRNDTVLCTHQSINIDATGYPGCTYLWNDGSTVSSYLAEEQNEGNYIYKVKVGYNGCFVTDSVGIQFNKSPDVEVHKSNDINCLTGRAILVAEGAMNYSWDPANYLTNPNKPKTIATPDVSTTYRVIGKNQNGCADTAYIPLNVNFSDGADKFGVPSAFTPNGDGLNDCFGVSYWGRVNNFSLSVYDRWGRRLYHSTNPSECWDGKWKGKAQVTGSYVYDLKGEGACGLVSRKGNLILIR